MREVVSLQLGGYANYVGAHFWNLHDEFLALGPSSGSNAELSSDVYFRSASGRNPSLPYAPRLQILDLVGAFGCLSVDSGSVTTSLRTSIGKLSSKEPATGSEHESGPEALWGGPSQLFNKPGPPLSSYQGSLLEEDKARASGHGAHSMTVDGHDGADDFELDSTVKYWSDYLKVRLHPRTCSEVPGIHAGVNEFGTYDDGVGSASTSFLDDVYDNLRFFFEGCESLGGLQVTCDALGGFSGLGEKYLSLLRDELGSNANIIVFGTTSHPVSDSNVDPATAQRKLGQSRYNESMLVHAMTQLSIQYIPLRAEDTPHMPLLSPVVSNPFQTSAVLGTAIDFFSTPLRHTTQHISFTSLLRNLRPAPFAALSGISASFPVLDPINFRHSAVLEIPGMTRLSPPLRKRAAVRGISVNSAKLQKLTSELLVGRGISGNFPSVCQARTRVAVPIPYPHFFDDRLDSFGQLRPQHTTIAGCKSEVAEMNGLTALYTDSSDNNYAFQSYSDVLVRAAVKRSTSTHNLTEQASLLEASDDLLALASDCREALNS